MIKLTILLLGYLFAGLILALLAKDKGKSRLYRFGLLFAWPLYIWIYVWYVIGYYGSRLVKYVLK